MEMTAGGGQFLCASYNTGGCNCAPACPSGYMSMGCECVWGQSVLNQTSQINHSHFLLYLLSVIGLIAITFGVGYLIKNKFMNKAKTSESLNVEITSKYTNMIESK